MRHVKPVASIATLLALLLLAPSTSAQTLPAEAPPVEAEPPAEAPRADETAPSAPPATSAPAEPAEAAPIVEAPPAEEALESQPSPDVEEIPVVEAPADKSEEIVVTGSRVRRTSFQASAPVQVIDRQALEYSGATNLADVIQYMTVSQGSGFQGGANAVGTASINLRGLGAGATLVLLNGRRTVPSGGGIDFNFVDLSTIPLAVVERIEILKGGASAIYGSDAVGGVVNIITRKNWDGTLVQLEGQAAEEFDYKEGTGSVAFGAASERSRVSLGVSYHRAYELLLADRDFSAGPPSGWHGYRDSEALKEALGSQAISALGNPGAFGTPLPLADPACASVAGSAVDNTAVGGLGSLCAGDYRPFVTLLGNVERVTSYGYGEYDLTAHTALFAELNVSRMREDRITSPSFSLPPRINPPFPSVPADHVDNPAGAEVNYYGRPLGREAGPAVILAADDTLRSVVGLRGDLLDAAEGTAFEDWEWELFATLGVSRYLGLTPDNLRSRFQESLDACADPADLSGCFNPYHSAVDGTGTPNAASVVDGFTGTATSITDHQLRSYNAGVTGSLLELPGGDLGFALGGEMRHETRASELDHDSNQFDFGFFLGNSDAIADRDVLAGYAELVFPVYDGVELQTAGRLENYSDVGLVGNPTAGLSLMPSAMVGSENVADAFERLTLRGHVASAFRAPTLYQTFPGAATVPTQLADMGTPAFVPVRYWGRPELEPEDAIALSGGLTWNPIQPVTLDGDYWYYRWQSALMAEAPLAVLRTGRSEVEGFESPLVPVVRDGNGILSELNATTVNLDDSIVTQGVDVGLMLKLDRKELGADVGTFRVGAQGTYTFEFDAPRFQEFEGEQVALVPDIELTGGATQTPHACDDERCDFAGQLNGENIAPPLPRLRVNFPLSWSYADHLVAFVAHYTSGMEDDAHYDPASGEYNTIDPWTTFDLQYGYTVDGWFGESLGLRVGVYNLLDTDPPFVDEATGFTPVHDPRGRVFFAKVLGEF